MEGTLVDLSAQVWYLRSGGLSVPEIAQKLQLSREEVIRRFRDYRLDLAKDVSLEEREQIVQLELARLDAMQYPQWDAAMQGDVKAVEAVLKIMQMRMKYLGLDMVNPTTDAGKQQILIVGTSKEEFIEALQNGKNQLTGSHGDDEEDEEGDK